MNREIKKTEQKALEINLDNKIYGSFAEIGAGQEVARNFFQVGAAVGTIAKTMSAYDKTYSDAIYGVEDSGRYVCESRLYKMLDHEYGLMEERLQNDLPDTKFFAFADTVAAVNYRRTIKGNGWLGVRFQLDPSAAPNELVIHVKMKDKNNRQQQQAIGILGVNLIYAAFYHHTDLEQLIASLIDGIKERVSIDFVRLTGPSFKEVDNRLLTLYLVKHGLTEVAMFDNNGNSVHASEIMYKKGLMVVRGNFKPPTLVTEDVINSGFKQFVKDTCEDEDKCDSLIMTEITIDNLKKKYGEISDRDFIDRADMLNALGQSVIISDCSNHQKLINYLSDYKIKHLGLVIGVWELKEIIEKKFEENQDGRLLVAFGELFTRNIRIYVYPAMDEDTNTLVTAKTLIVPEGIHFLYKHLIDSQQIVEIEEYKEENLHIYPYRVVTSIQEGSKYWEDKVTKKVADVIKKNGSFGYVGSNIAINI